MKLIRFGEPGEERPGVIDSTNTLRDLSGVITDWDYQTLVPDTLARVAGLNHQSLPAVSAEN